MVFLAGLVASALNFSMGLQGSITHLHDDVEPYRQTFSENLDPLLYVGDTGYSCTLTLVLQSAPTLGEKNARNITEKRFVLSMS